MEPKQNNTRLAILLIIAFTIIGGVLMIPLFTPERVHVNLETEQKAFDLTTRRGEPVTWEELEAILGPGKPISVTEYIQRTGYKIRTDANYECRIWKARDGSWIVYAYDANTKLSSYKSYVRRR